MGEQPRRMSHSLHIDVLLSLSTVWSLYDGVKPGAVCQGTASSLDCRDHTVCTSKRTEDTSLSLLVPLCAPRQPNATSLILQLCRKPQTGYAAWTIHPSKARSERVKRLIRRFPLYREKKAPSSRSADSPLQMIHVAEIRHDGSPES